MFICMDCLADNIPFSNLNDIEFSISVTKGINYTINNEDFEPVPSPQQQELFDKLNNFITQNYDQGDGGEDENDTEINCQYFTTNEFCKQKFCDTKSVSILHLNIHSIQLHIEDLRIVLQILNFNFDIIAISESKLQDGIEPQIDITLNGFQTPISTPTKASKGGVLLYVANHINFKPRPDLNIYKSKELESAFIEIIEPGEANSIIGVIYRHSCMDTTSFNKDFLKKLLFNLSRESNNKNIFIAGDFNFDLIKVSSNDDTAEFFNNMTYNFLLLSSYYPTHKN